MSLSERTATAAEPSRVTHAEIIDRYPWVRDLGDGWRRTSGRNRYPVNQIPMYGGVEKNDAMLGADRSFLDRTASLSSSTGEAVKKLVGLGFRYFAQRDMATAMKRFNQAWLLDPDFGDIYHGFALVVIERDRDAVTTERLFRIAIGIENTGPRAFADYGRLLLIQKRYADAVPVLRQAVEKGPNLVSARVWLAAALFRSGQPGEACELIRAEQTRPEDAAKRQKLLESMNCAVQ